MDLLVAAQVDDDSFGLTYPFLDVDFFSWRTISGRNKSFVDFSLPLLGRLSHVKLFVG